MLSMYMLGSGHHHLSLICWLAFSCPWSSLYPLYASLVFAYSHSQYSAECMIADRLRYSVLAGWHVGAVSRDILYPDPALLTVNNRLGVVYM